MDVQLPNSQTIEHLLILHFKQIGIFEIKTSEMVGWIVVEHSEKDIGVILFAN